LPSDGSAATGFGRWRLLLRAAENRSMPWTIWRFLAPGGFLRAVFACRSDRRASAQMMFGFSCCCGPEPNKNDRLGAQPRKHIIFPDQSICIGVGECSFLFIRENP
jgi:hypothetical protein